MKNNMIIYLIFYSNSVITNIVLLQQMSQRLFIVHV